MARLVRLHYQSTCRKFRARQIMSAHGAAAAREKGTGRGAGGAGPGGGWWGVVERGSIVNDQSFHLQLFHNWSPTRVIQLHRTRLLQFVESREFSISFYSSLWEVSCSLLLPELGSVIVTRCSAMPGQAEALRPLPALKTKSY